MKNPIIESRLNKMIQRKQQLLKLKKSERGNELKETEDVINRLKKWLADPATHVQTPQQEQCITGNPAGHSKDKEKRQRDFTTACQNTVEAFKNLAKAFGGITITGGHTEAEREQFRRYTMTDEGFIRPLTETPGKGPESDTNEWKHPVEIDEWPQEPRERYQDRFMDVETAFRRMSGRA